MDAIELLVAQHRALENAFEDMLDDGLDAGARAKCYARAADELTIHIVAEEQLFYPAVRARRTEDILLESLEEHLSLKRLIADLNALDPADDTFVAKLKVLSEQAEHHHKEEEEHLFPKVPRLIDRDQNELLALQMLGLEQQLLDAGSPRKTLRAQTGSAEPLA